MGFILVSGRLFFWQILKGKELSSEAKNQYQERSEILAPRGNIFAKDGSYLAAKGDAWLVYASLPSLKDNPRRIAEKLAPFLVEKEEAEDESSEKKLILLEIDRIVEILERKNIVWVPIKRKVNSQVKKKIEALRISGIGFEKEEERIYPEASLAAHLLGFVGKDRDGDDEGYFGLEGYYNLTLTGKRGFVSQEKDAKGAPIVLGDRKEVGAIGGVDLVTHIDKSVQLTLEKELQKGLERYGAKGASGIIMNPFTGAIVAMASFPSYNPQKYHQFGNEFFKDPSIFMTFEPGSIFKVIVMASALDSGVVDSDTNCDICTGPYKVDKYLIETWNKKYNPNSTMQDVIVNSDNVGMVFVGQKLGSDKLFEYLDRFGIGKETGIDLQGEVTPKLRPNGSWNVVDLATATFGQGIAVTPIQFIRSASAIANGGNLVTPQIVDRIRGFGWEQDIKPQIGPRVISEEAAKKMTSMMIEAAKSGESKWTHLRGFKVAGKTGTAQIPIAGHYDSQKTIASFIGFAPADKPRFVMLVTLREPTSSPWASENAAPLWYAIAKDLFISFGIQPEI